MDVVEPWAFPPVITAFLLSMGMSLLLGLGLREYYLVNQKRVIFGTTRTCLLIGLLGFVLFQVRPDGLPYLGGLLVLGFWLGLFYRYKLAQGQSGQLGLLLALLSYGIGPASLTQPYWLLILEVIAALFILNAKEDIRLLTQRMTNADIIILAKFLVLSGVILPLTSRQPLAPFLPVSPHQTWLAVVVISGISYLSYLLQTYVLKGRGLLLTGAIGGLYSSTAATIVLARRSCHYPEPSLRPAAAMILATGMMYLRLLAIVTLFDFRLGLVLTPLCLGLFAIAGAMAWLLRVQDHQPSDGEADTEAPQNPLELTAALVFALSFLVVTGLTHFILGHFPQQGLHWLAFFTGFTDIDPFVLALVGGHLAVAMPAVGKAILIAAASNNLLKAGYVLVLCAGRSRRMASGGLALLAGLSLGGAMLVVG